jgi:hypothetical protein
MDRRGVYSIVSAKNGKIEDERKMASGPPYAVGYLVAFGAVEITLFLLTFLGYLLITSIAFHKPNLYEVKQDKLSPFGK